MVDPSAPCPACDQPVPAGKRICPACGAAAATSEPSGAAAPNRSGDGGRKKPGGASRRGFARTMHGMPSDMPPVGQATSQAASTAGPGQTGGRAGGSAEDGHNGRHSGGQVQARNGAAPGDRTPEAPQGGGGGVRPGAEPERAVPDPRVAGRGRTMLGMAPGLSDSVKAAVERAKQAGPAAFNPNQTQLDALSDAAPGEPAHKARAAQALGGRTMLGVPNAGAAGVDEPAGPPGPASARPQPSSYPPASEQPPQNKLVWILAGVAISLLLAGAAAVLMSSGEQVVPGPNVQVDIVDTDGREAMRFVAPEAKAGSKIVFGDQSQPLVEGEARFPLAVDSLVVGENLVVARVVAPDGSEEQVRIPLKLDFRVRVDTAPLLAGEGRFELKVAAVPGTRVRIDGEPLELDGNGNGAKAFPYDMFAGGRSGPIEHVARYRIEPPGGEPVEDELRMRVPVTMMQVDSPGFELTTDRPSLPLKGLVGKGVTVQLDGKAVAVDPQGRFADKLALPKPGRYAPELVAKAEGKAPFGVRLAITRVADLAKAAAGYAADAKLSYATIVKAPEAQRGKRVAFEGRVFRAKSEGGRSVLQMLVRDCPKGMQCSLWVTYPAALPPDEVGKDTWVRVVGVADGLQQFRAKNNEVVSVPRLAAAFVLPIER